MYKKLFEAKSFARKIQRQNLGKIDTLTDKYLTLLLQKLSSIKLIFNMPWMHKLDLYTHGNPFNQFCPKTSIFLEPCEHIIFNITGYHAILLNLDDPRDQSLEAQCWSIKPELQSDWAWLSLDETHLNKKNTLMYPTLPLNQNGGGMHGRQ